MTNEGIPAGLDGVTGGPATPPPRRFLKRWLAGGGVLVLAVLVGLVLVLRSGTSGCAVASAPAGGTVQKGTASFYDGKGSGGNCSFPSAPADRLYVALGPSAYADAAACGSYLDVTGPKGTVRVMVIDQCAGCRGGKIDLSTQAFARIADPARGIVPVTYRRVVDPPLAGPLTFRMKDGASQWWFAVQVGNHGNPLKSVEAKRAGSSWRAAARKDYNYWLIDGGIGPGPYSIRVTDVYGHRVVAEGIRVTTTQPQKSTVRMYGDAAPASTGPASTGPAVSSPPVTPTPVATVPPSIGAGAPSGPAAVALAASPGPEHRPCGS